LSYAAALRREIEQLITENEALPVKRGVILFDQKDNARACPIGRHSWQTALIQSCEYFGHYPYGTEGMRNCLPPPAGPRITIVVMLHHPRRLHPTQSKRSKIGETESRGSAFCFGADHLMAEPLPGGRNRDGCLPRGVDTHHRTSSWHHAEGGQANATAGRNGSQMVCTFIASS
jgi:hypothetical protein